MTDSTIQLEDGADAFVDLLNSSLLAECIEMVNNVFSLQRMSKLNTELLPTNERNLTDARTRIGVLLEYAFALAVQEKLKNHTSSAYRTTFVISNRYPDIVIRDGDSRPIIRLEMKALDLESEEKSANFDTLVRDIHPRQDILCVLVWGWNRKDLGGVVVDYPLVQRAFAFVAYPIAVARDLGWLAQTNGRMKKGIDVLGPVVKSNKDDQAQPFRAEEHNMGKLMRVLGDNGIDDGLPIEVSSHPTVEAYRAFKSYTITEGLKHNTRRLFSHLDIQKAEFQAGFQHSAREIGVIATASTLECDLVVASQEAGNASKRRDLSNRLKSLGIDSAYVVLINSKFSWWIYEFNGESLRRVQLPDVQTQGKKLMKLADSLSLIFAR